MSSDPVLSARRRTPIALVVALIVGALAAPPGARADESWPVQPSAVVPQPVVEGPIPHGVGIRTGKPYRTTLVPLAGGYVEQEFFFRGMAQASPAGARDTAFASRILVRRPVDASAFNGTVLVDWTNVTVPDDTDVSWLPMHRTIMERGFVYVAVAAQLLAIEASPLALKQWDPVRYSTLNHPGDTYSFDIFSQAAEAVLDPIVLGSLRPGVERRLALGASQSGGRLNTYINGWQQTHGIFDGFQPQVSGAGSVRRDVAPVLWFNSSSEIGNTDIAADSGLFRLWEVAGPAHTTNEYSTYENAVYVYSHSNGLSGDPYDEEATGNWGSQLRPGTCNARNYYPLSYVASAAIVALDNWVRTGVAPAPQPRATRVNGARAYDVHGNLLGGVRSPVVDVPIATYYGGGASNLTACSQVGGRLPLTGTTEVFDPLKLAALYPTVNDYLTQLQGAVTAALAAGTLLPEGAADLMRRATTYGLPKVA